MTETEKTGLVSRAAGQTITQRALLLLSGIGRRFSSMPSERRISLLAGAAVLLGVVLGMTWYVGRPDWRVLFSGLEAKDVQVVSQELAAAGIPFTLTADGSGVQVPAEQIDKARMEVAAKGMPQTGRLGFELFDKPNWVGSEFDERVNYQRALEGELEHTISTLGAVRSARVHLVLPQASLFTSEEKIAKASVVLKLKHEGMSASQIESIRNLVAGAVENLTPEQVTLVDADGRIDLQNKNSGGTLSSDEAGAEQRLEEKLIAMLEPAAGVGNVRATVNVSFDQGSEEKTDEVYDPALTATLSVQKSEQTSGAGVRATGVPGTASNSPAAAPAGAVQGSAQAAAPGIPPLLQGKEGVPIFPQSGGQMETRKEETGSYAVTRHLVHTEHGPGRIRRISAAVVVNDRRMAEGSVKLEHIVWRPRTMDEMHRLEELAQAAVGFDLKRGDQVALENLSFSSNEPEATATGLDKMMEQTRAILGTQQSLLKTAMTGLLGLLVIWFLLRPIAGQVVSTLKETSRLGGVQQEALAGGAAQELISDSLANGLGSGQSEKGESEGRHASGRHEEPLRRPKIGQAVFDRVSEHIRREPSQSTRLLEAWISSDGDED